MMKVALWVSIGAILIVLAGSALADNVIVRCYPRPAGDFPPEAVVYSGGIALALLDTLLPEHHLPPLQSLAAERRGPDVVVLLLSGVMVCPLPVDRQDWEEALRKVLGEKV